MIHSKSAKKLETNGHHLLIILKKANVQAMDKNGKSVIFYFFN
jgi:hypothetical protein